MDSNIAFKNIAKEMQQRKITVEYMAKVIGVTPNTMRKKLARKSAIKLDEVVLIMNECFPGCDTKVLFKELADEVRDMVVEKEINPVQAAEN